MIRYCDNEGIVEVHGLHYKNNQKENIILPSVAIGVFSRFLVKDLVKKFKGKKVGYISCANYESDVYIINYKNQNITIFMAHIGAPRIADDIEELRVHGVKMFIIMVIVAYWIKLLKIVVLLFQQRDIEKKE